MTKIPHVVRFGIPTLDRLLGVVRSDSEGNERDTYGISVKPIADQNVVDTISLCVIGADGVGKSLLALHLASRYRSDATNILKALAADKAKTSQVQCGVCPHVSPAPVGPNPFIVYASTDLSINIPVTINEPGVYAISFRYANGNGPVNTENKCAIRALSIDKKFTGTLVFPQRGNGEWSN